MSKQAGKVQLESRITEGTGLQAGSDYILTFVKNKRRITEPSGNEFNPENWVSLNFPRWWEKDINEGKRSIILDFLEKENIEHFPNGKTHFVRIPEESGKIIELEIKNAPFKDPPEVINKRFDNLKELHKRLPIYGVPNTDQPDLYTYGIVNFNYFDQEQTDEAYRIFYNAGFGVEERKGKKFNLTFVLLTEGIDESKLAFGKGRPNGKTVKIFEWIIKKIHRKNLKEFSENGNFGISTRAKINMGAPEIFDLQQSLEDDFNMIIHVHSTSIKINESEFYLLISDKAKNLYFQSERKISICDLGTILKDPKKETEIIKKYKQNTTTMKEKKFLSTELIDIFKKNGYQTTQKGKEPYAQINHVDEKVIRVCVINTKEREKTISSLKEIILKKHPEAEIKLGKNGVNFLVSIPGYENPPKRTFTRKAKEDSQKPEKPQPTPEPPKIETPIPKNVLQDTEKLEERLRELVKDGNLSDDVLKDVKFFLAMVDADREAVEIMKKWKQLK